MKIIISLLFLFFSASAFPDRILLTGKPAVLIANEYYFNFPESYVHTKRDLKEEHLFVRLNGTDRVCYIQQQPMLAPLDMVQIFIEYFGHILQWNCYRYDSRFFEVNY